MIEPIGGISGDLVAGHYDELDHWYRVIWGEHVHHGLWQSGRETVEQATRGLIDHMARQLAVSEGQTICDVGCGYGGTTRVLARSYGASVTGVTLSQAQLDYARQQTRDDRTTYIRMDFLDNEFADASFDTVIAIESSEHIADKPKLFSEIHRILKPGGRFGVCAWLARTDYGAKEKRFLLEPICREGRLPGMGTEPEYLDFFSQAGFANTSFADVSRKVERTWPIIIRRLLLRLTWDGAAWKFLFGGYSNVVFVKSLLRIAVAYRLGAMRYGIFISHKPETA